MCLFLFSKNCLDFNWAWKYHRKLTTLYSTLFCTNQTQTCFEVLNITIYFSLWKLKHTKLSSKQTSGYLPYQVVLISYPNYSFSIKTVFSYKSHSLIELYITRPYFQLLDSLLPYWNAAM
jgi:hypothetical protein